MDAARSPRYSISRPPEDGLSPFPFREFARRRGKSEGTGKKTKQRPALREHRKTGASAACAADRPTSTTTTSLHYDTGSSRCGGAREKGGRRRRRGVAQVREESLIDCPPLASAAVSLASESARARDCEGLPALPSVNPPTLQNYAAGVVVSLRRAALKFRFLSLEAGTTNA
ncbi:hypothetical protein HPB50_013008 [Hyalomma asiaticum]|uniref:Uncharacterized protein n=1 Tax=Hyalomma asiaticum TaxID=266040 RepID=A0ACB7S649_HYAAI|nr:hypothetical protein HPB50_013008 [Hyalomma asiaticum]